MLILSGIALYAWKEVQLTQHVHTVATIVDLKTKRTDNRYSHSPIIEFEGPRGRRIRYESPIGSSRPIGAVGDTIPVYYDPDDADNVTIDRFFQKHFVAVIVLCAGVGLFLVTRIRRTDAERSDGPREH